MSASIAELERKPTSQEILGQAALADPVRFSQRASELYSLVARLDTLPPTKHIPSEVVAMRLGSLL